MMESLHMGDITVLKTVTPAMMERWGFLSGQREKAREMQERLESARRGMKG